MVQDVINRMAKNSFALKGWAVTLVSGIFALSAKDTDKMYFLIAYVPILVFWGLDSYYLLQEKLYRALYNKARKEESTNSFSLSATTDEVNDEKCNYWKCVKSPTEIGFYLPLAMLCAIIVFLTNI